MFDKLKSVLHKTTYCPMKSARRFTDAERSVIEREVAELGPWFQNFQLGADVWTNPGGAGPGPQYPDSRWRLIEPLLPDVSGKTVLDVGCSSGFFSLKLKELGAAYVLGIDAGEQPKAIEQARFAATTLGLDAGFRSLSVYDLRELGRQFDIVLFMGVLYHLRHPLLALEALRSVCGSALILQTITTGHDRSIEELDSGILRNPSLHSNALEDRRFPAVRFVEGALDKDVTCWFVPNPQAVLSMLRACFFTPNQMTFSDDHDIIVRSSVG